METDKWGTWEELLLGSAVKRHGANNWESVAMELQARKLSPYAFSPQECKAKYYALQGRFNNHNNCCSNTNSMLWVEELRKLRVAQLKRELQLYDGSIVSLHSKLKRLKAEREESLAEKSEERDLREEVQDGCCPMEGGAKARKTQDLDDQIPNGPWGKADPGSANECEDPSVQRQKQQPLSVPKPGDGETHKQRTSKCEIGACAPASPLDSYYGSSDTIAKENPPHRTMSSEEGEEEESRRVHIVPSGDGLQEGSAESREFGEEKREDSSDVLSSAEFWSRRREDGSHAEDGGRYEEECVGGWEEQNQAGLTRSSGDSQAEGTDDMSPMSKRSRSRREAKVPGKLLPLLECLRAIGAHKFGSLFKHKIQSQDNLYYRSIIRKHVDLGIVRSRLEEGSYSGSMEFFRDVLLVFNNALVYYPKHSQEFVAAYVLRELATKEMANIFQTEALLKQEGPLTRNREPRKGSEFAMGAKPAPNPSIVCRKRNPSSDNQMGRSKTARQALEQQSFSSADIQLQQSEGGKEIEMMKDAEVNEIKIGKGKVEGPKLTVGVSAHAPMTHNPDIKLEQKTQDAKLSNSKRDNAGQQSKPRHMERKDIQNIDEPIKSSTQTKRLLSADSKKGANSSSSSISKHDVGMSSSELLTSKKSSNGTSVRPKKICSVTIEPTKSCSHIISQPIDIIEQKRNNFREHKMKEVLNLPLNQPLSANATIQAHEASPVKRGVGRPPKHAKLASEQKQRQRQRQRQQEANHLEHKQGAAPTPKAAEPKLPLAKPRKRARR